MKTESRNSLSGMQDSKDTCVIDLSRSTLGRNEETDSSQERATREKNPLDTSFLVDSDVSKALFSRALGESKFGSGSRNETGNVKGNSENLNIQAWRIDKRIGLAIRAMRSRWTTGAKDIVGRDEGTLEMTDSKVSHEFDKFRDLRKKYDRLGNKSSSAAIRIEERLRGHQIRLLAAVDKLLEDNLSFSAEEKQNLRETAALAVSIDPTKVGEMKGTYNTLYKHGSKEYERVREHTRDRAFTTLYKGALGLATKAGSIIGAAATSGFSMGIGVFAQTTGIHKLTERLEKQAVKSQTDHLREALTREIKAFKEVDARNDYRNSESEVFHPDQKNKAYSADQQSAGHGKGVLDHYEDCYDSYKESPNSPDTKRAYLRASRVLMHNVAHIESLLEGGEGKVLAAQLKTAHEIIDTATEAQREISENFGSEGLSAGDSLRETAGKIDAMLAEESYLPTDITQNKVAQIDFIASLRYREHQELDRVEEKAFEQISKETWKAGKVLRTAGFSTVGHGLAMFGASIAQVPEKLSGSQVVGVIADNAPNKTLDIARQIPGDFGKEQWAQLGEHVAATASETLRENGIPASIAEPLGKIFERASSQVTDVSIEGGLNGLFEAGDGVGVFELPQEGAEGFTPEIAKLRELGYELGSTYNFTGDEYRAVAEVISSSALYGAVGVSAAVMLGSDVEVETVLSHAPVNPMTPDFSFRNKEFSREIATELKNEYALPEETVAALTNLSAEELGALSRKLKARPDVAMLSDGQQDGDSPVNALSVVEEHMKMVLDTGDAGKLKAVDEYLSRKRIMQSWACREDKLAVGSQEIERKFGESTLRAFEKVLEDKGSQIDWSKASLAETESGMLLIAPGLNDPEELEVIVLDDAGSHTCSIGSTTIAGLLQSVAHETSSAETAITSLQKIALALHAENGETLITGFQRADKDLVLRDSSIASMEELREAFGLDHPLVERTSKVLGLLEARGLAPDVSRLELYRGDRGNGSPVITIPVAAEGQGCLLVSETGEKYLSAKAIAALPPAARALGGSPAAELSSGAVELPEASADAGILALFNDTGIVPQELEPVGGLMVTPVSGSLLATTLSEPEGTAPLQAISSQLEGTLISADRLSDAGMGVVDRRVSLAIDTVSAQLEILKAHGFEPDADAAQVIQIGTDQYLAIFPLQDGDVYMGRLKFPEGEGLHGVSCDQRIISPEAFRQLSAAGLAIDPAELRTAEDMQAISQALAPIVKSVAKDGGLIAAISSLSSLEHEAENKQKLSRFISLQATADMATLKNDMDHKLERIFNSRESYDRSGFQCVRERETEETYAYCPHGSKVYIASAEKDMKTVTSCLASLESLHKIASAWQKGNYSSGGIPSNSDSATQEDSFRRAVKFTRERMREGFDAVKSRFGPQQELGDVKDLLEGKFDPPYHTRRQALLKIIELTQGQGGRTVTTQGPTDSSDSYIDVKAKVM